MGKIADFQTEYEKFKKEYKSPYRDEKDKNIRIKLLEERVFSNECALREYRETVRILNLLLEASEQKAL